MATRAQSKPSSFVFKERRVHRCCSVECRLVVPLNLCRFKFFDFQAENANAKIFMFVLVVKSVLLLFVDARPDCTNSFFGAKLNTHAFAQSRPLKVACCTVIMLVNCFMRVFLLVWIPPIQSRREHVSHWSVDCFRSGWFKFTCKRLNTVCLKFFRFRSVFWFSVARILEFYVVLLCRDLSRHCVLLM